MTRAADPAEASPIALRDITIGIRRIRISASATSATVTVFELVDRINPVFIGQIIGADSGQPKLRLARDNTAWAEARPIRDMIRAAALSFWRQIRAAYIRSLGTLGLPILAAPQIAGRTVRLALVYRQPRIRVTFATTQPFYIGCVVDLHTGTPRLVPGASHLDWVRTGDRVRRIVDESVLAYAHRDRRASTQIRT